jgi:hypothetical protein
MTICAVIFKYSDISVLYIYIRMKKITIKIRNS